MILLHILKIFRIFTWPQHEFQLANQSSSIESSNRFQLRNLFISIERLVGDNQSFAQRKVQEFGKFGK